jgi:hypothetical protein
VARAARDLTTSTAIAPHKTFLLVVSLIGGVIGMFYPGLIATSINQSFPPGFQITWFGGLAVTSAVALYGVFRRSLVGLLYERVALLAQTLLLIAYMVAILGVNGDRGVGASLFYVGYATANLYRAWIITHTLRLYPPPHPAHRRLRPAPGGGPDEQEASDG